MGILDEAIREHLELKRQHGADDSELKQLEDDAFGPPGRPGDEKPDPVAEAATEFMAQPDLGDDAKPGAEGESSSDGEAIAEAPARREPATGLVDLQEAPETSEDESGDGGEAEPAAKEDEPEAPAEEDHPAGELEAVPGSVKSGPNT